VPTDTEEMRALQPDDVAPTQAGSIHKKIAKGAGEHVEEKVRGTFSARSLKSRSRNGPWKLRLVWPPQFQYGSLSLLNFGEWSLAYLLRRVLKVDRSIIW
jgi:hypothetical protein